MSLVFERNHYFYGKLLTSRDFKEEQTYFNQKRYLLNRLIHGHGIVWGLNVQEAQDVGNHVLEVGSGVALDEIGREIVVDDAERVDLRRLHAYPSEAEESKLLYLVLQYEECPREPMPVLVNAPSCKEDCEPNRIREGYKFALTDIAPKAPVGIGRGHRHEATTLLHTDQLDLARIVPKWVQADDVFEVVLRLTVNETIAAAESVHVEVTEILPDACTMLFQDALVFTLTDVPAGTAFEQSYVVRAGNEPGVATIEGQTAVQAAAGNAAAASPASSVTVIAEEAVYEHIAEQHFADQSEGGWLAPERSVVYLAELKLGDNRSITEISPHVREYVYSNPLLAELIGSGDDAGGKLLRHRLSHMAGGSDQLDVSDLPGVLAQPQKVTVLDGGGAAIEATAIRFVGDGVAVAHDGQAAVVTITGVGGGLIPDERPPVVTGFVNFKDVKPAEFRSSKEIALPIKQPCAIQLAIEYASPTSETLIGFIGDLADRDARLSAVYDLNRYSFQILLQDPRPKEGDVKCSYRVRYWIIPPTEIKQNADKEGELSFQDYVLSRLILFGGLTIEQLSIDPLLRDKVKVDDLKVLMEKLSNDNVVKHVDGDMYVAV
ncbi:hypothetical protein I8J29_05205 [Paenibacillus sp. MWE-103]|uniref:Uncharacterized protein n=1 Tax=Paenibacillus artemisiicola TaxID=1172618 RepID=A0ABS3W5I9_9BACL|nr:hypothetical protein [Paenibacillus artemisiicola]MBO7743582.1 hypothetical protein [Paenibacillus artemisiicola]